MPRRSWPSIAAGTRSSPSRWPGRSCPTPTTASPDRRLRIGFVSPDFRDHVVGHNLLPLFRDHDRRQVEIFCYSDVTVPMRSPGAFKADADDWRDVAGRSDAQVAQLVRADRIDILVDLALHTASNRLLVFARKPAPVQVSLPATPARPAWRPSTTA